MKHHTRIFLAILILLNIIINSCQKDEEYITTNNLEDTSAIDLYGSRKLENPYTVSNMKKALENIKSKIDSKKITGKTSKSIEGLEITISHYYIKFIPETKEQEGIIKQDSTLHVFDYPLDWEFTDEYLDNRPELPEGTYPEYYTAVPIDKALLESVPYEIIEELYIPEEDPMFNNDLNKSNQGSTKQGTIDNNEDLLRHLLNEAYTLTGNEKDLYENPKNHDNPEAIWIFGSKWYPSGTLKIWDDNAGKTTILTKEFSHWIYYDCGIDDNAPIEKLMPQPDDQQCKKAVYTYSQSDTQGKYIPLVGAQVLMRQWFTVRQGITDNNGHFNTGSVRGKARYVIQWERYEYSIRNGSFFQAETRGPRVKKQDWNHSIKGGDDEYHGMIHTAAHAYYYGGRFGLTSPPTNALLKKQMKIAAREQNGQSSHIHQRRWIHLAQIHIKEWGEPSHKVFGTTIHELAHAAHWNMDRSAYNNLGFDGYILGEDGDKRTLETWATTVEIMFARNRYKDYFNNPEYKYKHRDFQDQTILSENFYTSAGYDMIDNINQRNHSDYGNKNIAYPIDRVSGYTIKELEDGLKGAKSWIQWRNNIKAKTNNPTEGYINELFSNWD